jgi:hypothetical protein
MTATATEAMPDYEEIAGQLYDHYCVAVGGKAFNNDPLPSWEDFRSDPKKQKQSDAWVEVAKKAVEILGG